MGSLISKFCRCRSWRALAGLASGVWGFTASAAMPHVQVLDEPRRIEAAVQFSADATRTDEQMLSVAIIDETGQVGQPIFGTYGRESGALIFRPRFPLTAGARYRITSGPDHLDYEVPAASPHPAATVEHVYPACSTVPANLLKFYVQFSRPMREGREVFTHIHLLDEAGKAVDAPWRDTELWTEDGRRLTLWIHPGRVKRGVNLREDLGPVLRPDEQYTLVIDARLRDATGQTLGTEYRQTFRTTEELHRRLDLAGWKFVRPTAGTREPFRAITPVGIDEALARRCLHFFSAAGPIAGTSSLAADGRSWLFTPDAPWPGSSLTFSADPWLEDLAGNTFARVFDDDTTAAPEEKPAQVTWDFTPAEQQNGGAGESPRRR